MGVKQTPRWKPDGRPLNRAARREPLRRIHAVTDAILHKEDERTQRLIERALARFRMKMLARSIQQTRENAALSALNKAFSTTPTTAPGVTLSSRDHPTQGSESLDNVLDVDADCSSTGFAAGCGRMKS